MCNDNDRMVIRFDTIDSTNSYIKANMAALPSGTIATARHQTAGKGRLGRKWVDDTAEMLMFSYLAKGVSATALTAKIALAVMRSLVFLCNAPALIKWPNDIIIGEKKACGILCESCLSRDGTFDVVCGIGINLNTPAEFFIANDLPYATSVLRETGNYTEDERLMLLVAEEIEQLLPINFALLKDEYIRHCITLDKAVFLNRGNEQRSAVAIGIDDDGGLICRDVADTFTVSSGEVSVRGQQGYV